MKKIAIFLGLAPFFLSTGIASAAGGCAPVYGGGAVCDSSANLTINKTVQNPQTGIYVDSLGTSDAHFQPGQTANFRLVVANTTKSQIKNITVKDYLPASVMLLNGNGMYDTTTHVLTFTIDSLNANTSKTYTLSGRVTDNNSLPGNNPLICMTNGATAESGSVLAQDNSGFCVEKSVTTGRVSGTTGTQTQANTIPYQTKGGQIVYAPQGNKTSPATGAEALGYAALLPLGALGAFLRKKV